MERAETRGEESSLGERVQAERGEKLQCMGTRPRRYHICKLHHELGDGVSSGRTNGGTRPTGQFLNYSLSNWLHCPRDDTYKAILQLASTKCGHKKGLMGAQVFHLSGKERRVTHPLR